MYQYAIAIDPATPNIVDVVEHDKFIHRCYQLEIAEIGQEIWLHDGKGFHASL